MINKLYKKELKRLIKRIVIYLMSWSNYNHHKSEGNPWQMWSRMDIINKTMVYQPINHILRKTI